MVHSNNDTENNEGETKQVTQINNDNLSSDEELIISRSKPRRAVLSDDDFSNDEDSSKVKLNLSTGSQNQRKIIDSSDDEDINNLSRPKSTLNSRSEDEDSDIDIEQLRKRVTRENDATDTSYAYNRDIYDVASSDDERRPKDKEMQSNSGSDSDQQSESKNKKLKLKKKSLKKSEKMPSKKEREQNMQKIHSESQRMIRETEISLPYHRPKQRSLAEFLNRKQKTKHPQKRRSLKMSMKDINILREIEESKKNVDIFYKSDSDEEEKALMKQEDFTNVKHTDDGMQSSILTDLNDCSVIPQMSEVSKETYNLNDTERTTPMVNEETAFLGSENSLNAQLTEVLTEEVGGQITHKETSLESPLKEILSKEVSLNSETDILPTNNSEKAVDLNFTDALKSFDFTQPIQSSDTKKSPERETFEMLPSEDLKLHLDTEEMEEDSFKLNFTENSQEFLQKTSPIKKQSTPSTSSKNPLITPKMNAIISKFPNLDVNKLTNTTPKLGCFMSGNVIDLDEDPQDRNKLGASLLVEKLVNHSAKKNKEENSKLELSIVSKEKGDDGEEKLISSSIFIEPNKNKDEEPVPGARLILLKSALKMRMMKQRKKTIETREKQKLFMDSEEIIEDFEDDFNDEEEMSGKSDTEYETESEPEENDVIITDKKRTKNQYLDEEAEDTDDDVLPDMDDDDQSDHCDEERTNDAHNDSSDDNVSVEMSSLTETSSLKIDENAVNSFEFQEPQRQIPTPSLVTQDCFDSQERAASSLDLMDSQLPGAQLPKSSKSFDNNDSFMSDELNTSVPLTIFSKLEPIKKPNSIEEHDKNRHLNIFLTPMVNSQFSSTEKSDFRIPNLATDSDSLNPDDILGLCSGKFTEAEPKKLCNDFTPTQNVNEILGLCSGSFSTDLEEPKKLCDDFSATQNANEILGLCSGVFTAPKPSVSSPEPPQISMDNEINSGINSLSNSNDANPTPEDLSIVRRRKPRVEILSSDDEQQDSSRTETRKKKRIVRLADSESENEGDVEFDDDEEPVVKKKKKFTGFKDNFRGGIRSDFLDKEAELSGSEEGSADEDEPDEYNDMMEREEGDDEQYDENELRDQVGKAHMKSLIAKDKKELRLLQELYFQDGDLHDGEGRKKNFKWQKINSEENDDGDHHSEEEEQMEDDKALEAAAERRKMKLEKQKMLLENKKKPDFKQVDELENVFDIKRTSSLPIIRNRNKVPLLTSNSTHSQNSPHFLNKSNSVHHQRSFLRRDSTTLEILSEKMKENGSSASATVVKQSGNFVFHSLTAEEVEKKKAAEERKRKRAEGLPSSKKPKVERSFFASNKNSPSLFKNF